MKRYWKFGNSRYDLRSKFELALGRWASPMEALFYQAARKPWYWPTLRGLKRQYPIGYYAVDFALPRQKIAIEVDGLHWHRDKAVDARRQAYIEARGWRVLRFTGSEVYQNAASLVKGVKRYARGR